MIKLKPHEERVFNERAELFVRLAKLSSFLKTEQCKSLPLQERIYMVEQEGAMIKYKDILSQRLKLWGVVK